MTCVEGDPPRPPPTPNPMSTQDNTHSIFPPLCTSGWNKGWATWNSPNYAHLQHYTFTLGLHLIHIDKILHFSSPTVHLPAAILAPISLSPPSTSPRPFLWSGDCRKAAIRGRYRASSRWLCRHLWQVHFDLFFKKRVVRNFSFNTRQPHNYIRWRTITFDTEGKNDREAFFRLWLEKPIGGIKWKHSNSSNTKIKWVWHSWFNGRLRCFFGLQIALVEKKLHYDEEKKNKTKKFRL